MLWLFISTFLALVVAVLVQWVYFLLNRPKDLPPGPFPLPLIGSVWIFFFPDDCKTFQYLYDKYGEAATIYAGTSLSGIMVFILGYDTILQVSNDPEIAAVASGRHPGLNKLRGVREGIIWAQYPEARDRRSLLLRAFKQYGLLTSKLAPLEEDEIRRLLDTITTNAEKPFNPAQAIREAVASCILLSVYGHRFDLTDKVCAEMVSIGEKFFECTRLDLAMLPHLKLLTMIVPDQMAEAERKMEVLMGKWLTEEIAARRPTFNPDHIRDLLDVYLQTAQSDQLDDGFLRSVVDIFGAASDTTVSAVSWALHYLAHMPDEQERLFQEIESVMSSSLYPTIENRSRLPRLAAFLEESARYSCMTPACFPRHCSAPFAFGPGKCYQMPAGASFTIGLYPHQFEQKYWLDPENFRVDRWLDPVDGKFMTSKRQVLQFGLGRRVCVGEQAARNLVFLTVGAFIQRFKWRFAEHVPFNSGLCRFLRIPVPYKLIFTCRQ